MAKRVRALCDFIVREHGGRADGVWTDATDGRDLRRRLMALPSFGEMKVNSVLAILAKRFGVDLPGLADELPRHPTLGDVDSPEALERYQAAKRAHKAELRARGERA
jgi:hypothetical protein